MAVILLSLNVFKCNTLKQLTVFEYTCFTVSKMYGMHKQQGSEDFLEIYNVGSYPIMAALDDKFQEEIPMQFAKFNSLLYC